MIIYLLFLTASLRLFFFFFNDTAPPEISTLSLHDALPISLVRGCRLGRGRRRGRAVVRDEVAQRDVGLVPHGGDHGHRHRRDPARHALGVEGPRSEEHTSELQSRLHLVCRLLLEKKKKKDD